MYDDLELKWLERYNIFLGVSHDCMSSIFVMLKSFWMECLEHKTELVCFLFITQETWVVVNSIDDDSDEAEYERTGALIYGVES